MTAEEFLTLHHQHLADIDVSASLKKFRQQMELGLNGQSGGMPMIPTYIMNVDRSRIKPNVKRILIDAGGTNFRSAIGYFDEKGVPHIERLKNTFMPATKGRLSKEQFYNAIADNIQRLLPEATDVGFCFSYQVDMGSDVDGTVVMFSKELDAPEVIGTKVGKETLAACRKYSDVQRKIVILNDTVATLLGGMATNDEQFSTYLGYIYGTGTNVCYVENTANISKVKDLPAGEMLINTECGNFDGFELGDFDKITIARTAVPDKQLFEKMTSGKYLADIMYEALLAAQRENVFIGKTTIVPFALKDVSEFLTSGRFCCEFEEAEDRFFAMTVCSLLIHRAALMGAIVNSALAMTSCKDKSLPVAIVAEGTTFNKLPVYRHAFEQYLNNILGSENIAYKIVQGEELNLVGTLMATMAL